MGIVTQIGVAQKWASIIVGEEASPPALTATAFYEIETGACCVVPIASQLPRRIATLAKRWQACVRDGDLVGRYGGDEFLVLLTGVAARAEVEPIIARLSEATSKPILIGDVQLSVGVTIGIALADEDSNDLERLIIAADRDMYASKRHN